MTDDVLSPEVAEELRKRGIKITELEEYNTRLGEGRFRIVPIPAPKPLLALSMAQTSKLLFGTELPRTALSRQGLHELDAFIARLVEHGIVCEEG